MLTLVLAALVSLAPVQTGELNHQRAAQAEHEGATPAAGATGEAGVSGASDGTRATAEMVAAVRHRLGGSCARGAHLVVEDPDEGGCRPRCRGH